MESDSKIWCPQSGGDEGFGVLKDGGRAGAPCCPHAPGDVWKLGVVCHGCQHLGVTGVPWPGAHRWGRLRACPWPHSWGGLGLFKPRGISPCNPASLAQCNSWCSCVWSLLSPTASPGESLQHRSALIPALLDAAASSQLLAHSVFLFPGCPWRGGRS